MDPSKARSPGLMARREIRRQQDLVALAEINLRRAIRLRFTEDRIARLKVTWEATRVVAKAEIARLTLWTETKPLPLHEYLERKAVEG